MARILQEVNSLGDHMISNDFGCVFKPRHRFKFPKPTTVHRFCETKSSRMIAASASKPVRASQCEQASAIKPVHFPRPLLFGGCKIIGHR
jgi:hypothetical protein